MMEAQMSDFTEGVKASIKIIDVASEAWGGDRVCGVLNDITETLEKLIKLREDADNE